jgi:hypothetical protein
MVALAVTASAAAFAAESGWHNPVCIVLGAAAAARMAVSLSFAATCRQLRREWVGQLLGTKLFLAIRHTFCAADSMMAGPTS